MALARTSVPVNDDRPFAAIEALCRNGFYAAGATIVHQGGRVDGILVNRSASLRLVHTRPGGRVFSFGLAAAGRVIGLTELMIGAEHQLTVEVAQGGEVGYVPRDTLVAHLRSDPAAAFEMLARASQEAQRYLAECCAVADTPSRERLFTILGEYAASHGEPCHDGTRLKVPLTVQDLAERVGCSRQWTSAMLREMSATGLIRRDRGWIIVTRAITSSRSHALRF